MRGSTPLDVAAASVMDNNELALALREPDLEKVNIYTELNMYGFIDKYRVYVCAYACPQNNTTTLVSLHLT